MEKSSYVVPFFKHRVLQIIGAVEEFVPEGATEPTRLTGTIHPANSTLTVARATRSRVSAFGLDFSAEGKNRPLSAAQLVGVPA